MTPLARHSLDPRLLAAAPELAILALLDDALAVCTSVLLTEHPTLGFVELSSDPEPPSLRQARRLLAAAGRTERAVERYRAAVLAALASTPADHEVLPF